MPLGPALVVLASLLPGQAEPPEQSTAKPAACSGAAMAFDRARERLVLFDGGGGSNCGPERQITWEHDGTAWQIALDGAGPSSRNFHAMIYDEARGVVVLYGGICRETRRPCTDAWAWDGSSWTEISTEGPGARYAVVLSYDPERQRVLLFGGRDGRGPFRDVWSWDGDAWTLDWAGYRGTL